MNKKILGAAVLGILSTVGVSGQVHAMTTLDTVYVEADRISGNYPGGFVHRKTNMGVLGKQDYMSTPIQGISITKELIDNVNLPNNTLAETLALSPAVRARSGKTYSDISIRGFIINSHDYLVDGIPGLMCQSSIPANFAERVDIISGPAGLLEGSTSVRGKSVGGTVDIITKKAGKKPVRKFTETFSGRGTFGESLDIGQRFGKEDTWGVRVNADFTKGTTYRKKEKMTNGNVFLNLDYEDGKDRGKLLFGHFYVNQFAPDLQLKLGNQAIPEPPDGSSNFQASWTNIAYKNTLVGLSYEHDFNEHLTWYIKGGYHDKDFYSCLASNPTLQDDKGNFKSDIYEWPLRQFRKSFVTGIRTDFKTGMIKHNVSLSFDKQWYGGLTGEWKARNNYSYYGNIYDNSIEKYPKPVVDHVDWTDYGDRMSSGISVIDTMEINNLSAMIGIRRQHDTIVKYDGTATSPSFGLVYKVTPQVSLYGNWMESVTPGVVVSKKYANKGEVLDPAETKQSEYGVKWDYKNIGGTFSYFDLRQQVPMEDEKTNTYGYNGKQKSRGFEFNVFGEPVKGLHLMGGFSHMKVENIGGTYDGKLYYGAPKWMASLAMQYDITPQFAMTSRITYNSSAWADGNNTKKIKPWTRLDLGAKYSWNERKYPITLSCNVINVLNHKYWYGALNNNINLGTPRTAVVTVSMDF